MALTLKLDDEGRAVLKDGHPTFFANGASWQGNGVCSKIV